MLYNYCKETCFILNAYENSVMDNPDIQILDSEKSGISCGV
jgi:hypothetical protein